MAKGTVAMRRSSSAVLVWLFLCLPCFAQTLGVITGEIRDSSGAVIPGATVTARNQSTNALRTAVSNGAGVYSFPALQPGSYTVKVELEGFRAVTRSAELQVQQTARVDFTLEVGQITETTEVSAVSPLLATENATMGTVIENKRIVELPLNGRNYLQLIALSPNVSADFAGPGQAGARQGGSRSARVLSVSPHEVNGLPLIPSVCRRQRQGGQTDEGQTTSIQFGRDGTRAAAVRAMASDAYTWALTDPGQPLGGSGDPGAPPRTLCHVTIAAAGLCRVETTTVHGR